MISIHLNFCKMDFISDSDDDFINDNTKCTVISHKSKKVELEDGSIHIIPVVNKLCLITF